MLLILAYSTGLVPSTPMVVSYLFHLLLDFNLSLDQADFLIVENYANQILTELKNRIAKMASTLELFTKIGTAPQ